MSFLPVLITCVVAGLLFAAGAFLIAAKSGVSLQETAEQPALTIGYRGFSVSAGSTLVGLILCSLLCMTVVPIALLFIDLNIQKLEHPMVLEANFTPPVPLNVTSTDDNPGTHDVKLRLFKSSEPQGFQISYPGYSEVVISVKYDWQRNKLVALVNGNEEPVEVLGDGARLLHIFALAPATVQSRQIVPAVFSSAAPIDSAVQAKADPRGIR